jgi:hypothetical protein
MSERLHFSPNVGNVARFIKQERGSINSHKLLTHEGFLDPQPASQAQLFLCIRQQREFQGKLLDKLDVGLDRIRAHSDQPNIAKIIVCVAKLARFCCSPGGAVFGIEKEHRLLSEQIFVRNSETVLIA